MDFQIILDNIPAHLKPGLQGQPLPVRENLLILYHMENNPSRIGDILKLAGVKKVKFCDCISGHQGMRIIKGAKEKKPIICRCTMRMLARDREGILLVNWKGYE